jgi:hypothetical protein
MKNNFAKGKRDDINVRILNPKEGVDIKRLSTALHLVFSERDLLNYWKETSGKKLKFHLPSPLPTRFYLKT